MTDDSTYRAHIGPMEPSDAQPAMDAHGACIANEVRLRAALSKACEALERYGQHAMDCTFNGPFYTRGPCICGLLAALSQAREVRG